MRKICYDHDAPGACSPIDINGPSTGAHPRQSRWSAGRPESVDDLLDGEETASTESMWEAGMACRSWWYVTMAYMLGMTGCRVGDHLHLGGSYDETTKGTKQTSWPDCFSVSGIARRNEGGESG